MKEQHSKRASLTRMSTLGTANRIHRLSLICRLSLRNLLRQKRRNLFLGIGIAFGMLVLVLASSFSRGMADVLVNDIVSRAFGHIVVGSSMDHEHYSVINDAPRLTKIIKDSVRKEDLVRLSEYVLMGGRAIGRGQSDNIVVIGLDVPEGKDRYGFFKNYLTLVDGNFDEYFSKDIEYPVIISEEKAKSLKVRVHDIIRVRLPMVTGQIQTAKLTVVAIANTNNSLANMVVFMETKLVKQLLGYKPWESATLKLSLKDPKRTARYYADLIHEKLTPGIITIPGKIRGRECKLVAFKNTRDSKEILKKHIMIIQGEPGEAFGKRGVMLSEGLSRTLELKVGDNFPFEYQSKFRGHHQEKFKINAIYKSSGALGRNVLLLNGERTYEFYNKYIPKSNSSNLIPRNDPLYPTLATEWKLLKRSNDSQALSEKYKEERAEGGDQTRLDVATMYEGASEILNLEGVLYLVTAVTVVILFCIIMIGVINTLQMTIKERTREIGTVRAIGMQKNDVRLMFIMETIFLTIISCGIGTLLAVVLMRILGSIRFEINNSLSLILKDHHLNFDLNPVGIVVNLLLVIAIALLASFFPAKRAAKLDPVEALRHYE